MAILTKNATMPMKTWTFNLDLFLRLDKVLDISFSSIARRAKMHQPALNRYIQQEFVISVETLIKICNAVRMPFRYFVAEDGVNVIPEREHATVPLEGWHGIQWNGKQAESIFYARRLSWAKVAEAMGVAKGQSAKNRFLDGTRFPIDGFLCACTKLQVSPWEFIADGNLPAANRDGATQRPARTARQEPAEVKRLKDTVAELNARLDRLQADNVAMMQKMEALLRRMEEMQQQSHREAIYGPVLDSNRALAAAEDGTEPELLA